MAWSMVLAGGCSGGSWYKSGEGHLLASLAALVAFASAAAASWLLAPAAPSLANPHGDGNGRGGQGYLAMLLHLNPWFIILPVVALVGFWLNRSSDPGLSRLGVAASRIVVVGLVGLIACRSPWAPRDLTASASPFLRRIGCAGSLVLTTVCSIGKAFCVGYSPRRVCGGQKSGRFRWRYPGLGQMGLSLLERSADGFWARP
ncbi:MAG: YeeE/YedE thiosulfate transporter family protein [Anaerolineae bacterium]